MKKITLIIFVYSLMMFSLGAQEDTLNYLFVGHTYEWHTAGDKVDTRLEAMDLSGYDGIWLGGDVCSEALLNYSTLEYIDSLFNLKHPNTHWTLGNHDTRNGNWIWLEELTGKKTYYTSHYKGISYIVLNTGLTPYHCEQLNEQYKIINDLCDTIQNSSHLILLMHHGLWNNVPGLPSPYNYAQSNLKYYNFNCYNVESTFVKEIYPKLIDVNSRGVKVICIMGDMGSQKMDYLTDDGVQFLGTGLNRSKFTDPVERENSPRDWGLVFKHLPAENQLEWEFVDFDILSLKKN